MPPPPSPSHSPAGPGSAARCEKPSTHCSEPWELLFDLARHRPTFERSDDVLGSEPTHCRPRFDRGRGGVRLEHDVLELGEARRELRLVLVDVEAGASNLPCAERLD